MGKNPIPTSALNANKSEKIHNECKSIQKNANNPMSKKATIEITLFSKDIETT